MRRGTTRSIIGGSRLRDATTTAVMLTGAVQWVVGAVSSSFAFGNRSKSGVAEK
jgi:hypothetical protein